MQLTIIFTIYFYYITVKPKFFKHLFSYFVSITPLEKIQNLKTLKISNLKTYKLTNFFLSHNFKNVKTFKNFYTFKLYSGRLDQWLSLLLLLSDFAAVNIYFIHPSFTTIKTRIWFKDQSLQQS